MTACLFYKLMGWEEHELDHEDHSKNINERMDRFAFTAE